MKYLELKSICNNQKIKWRSFSGLKRILPWVSFSKLYHFIKFIVISDENSAVKKWLLKHTNNIYTKWDYGRVNMSWLVCTSEFFLQSQNACTSTWLFTCIQIPIICGKIFHPAILNTTFHQLSRILRFYTIIKI